MLDLLKDSMKATAESNETAFARFYDLEYQGQFRRALLLLGTSSDADEAVQQAFVAVWTRWNSLQQPGPYNISADLPAEQLANIARTLVCKPGSD